MTATIDIGVLVLGSGPGGYVAAIRCGNAGWTRQWWMRAGSGEPASCAAGKIQ